MTFTYDSTLSSSKDKVRFRIGDTNSSAATGDRLEDEEITATIAAQPSFAEAMAQCAEALAGKFFTRATSKEAASLKVSYESRVNNLLDFAQRLRSGVEAVGGTDIVITGTSQTEANKSAADTDLIQPAFTRGQFDNIEGSVTAEDAA